MMLSVMPSERYSKFGSSLTLSKGSTAKVVAALPEKQRAAVLMHKYQEMDYSQIAGVLNCSESAVKSLLFRKSGPAAGANPWDAQFRHREMTIQNGHKYHVRFRARASEPLSARSKVGQAGPPYAEYWHQEVFAWLKKYCPPGGK